MDSLGYVEDSERSLNSEYDRSFRFVLLSWPYVFELCSVSYQICAREQQP